MTSQSQWHHKTAACDLHAPFKSLGLFLEGLCTWSLYMYVLSDQELECILVGTVLQISLQYQNVYPRSSTQLLLLYQISLVPRPPTSFCHLQWRRGWEQGYQMYLSVSSPCWSICCTEYRIPNLCDITHSVYIMSQAHLKGHLLLDLVAMEIGVEHHNGIGEHVHSVRISKHLRQAALVTRLGGGGGEPS